MSSDEEIKRPNGKKRVVNSDSEDDIEKAQSLEEEPDISIQQSDENEELSISKKKFQRVKRTVDSESDSDGNDNDADLEKSFAFSDPKKFNIFADNDLDDIERSRDEQSLNSKSSPTIIKKSNIYGDSDLYDAEGSDDENRLSPLHSMTNKYNDKDLYDAEGSSDEEQHRHSPPLKSSENAKKQQRKSAKAAKSEIEEIHRESQRIVRESNVSLPYHRPKQHTLAEFLQRRKSTPLMSLRTSKDKLNQVWKHLEERELEAVNFYKSDSEHSDEEKSHQNITLITSQNCNQSTEKLNSEKQIESKRIDLSHIKESNLDEDVTQVIESMLCTIVANCSKNDVLTYEASFDEIAKVIVNPIDTSQITLMQNSEELNKSIENTKSEVQNNTDKISESQNFELHLTESECFSEDITDVQVNCVKNNTITNKLDPTEPFLVTPSQDFELHLSESERLSEDFNITKLKTVDHFTKIEKSSDILSNSLSETLKEESKAVLDKITVEPRWMKAALEYEDDEYKNKTIQVDKPSIRLNIPKITSGPTEIVDLDDNGNTGVVDLMQRFMKHISLKTRQIHKKSSKQISIVSAERDGSGQVSEIKEEIVSLIMAEEEEDDPKLSKPGAKLVKLKAQLQAQIGQRRESEWTKKLKDQRLYEEEIYEGEKSECDAVDENIDESSESNEEEEEDEDEEEEEEEEDYNIEKNKKPKNEFVDEEAEVSEDESGGEGGDEDEDSVNSFIRRLKKKQTPLKKMESDDMFASQEIFNNQFEEDEDEDLLTIGQDSKDRLRDIEEVSDNEQQHNILTQSPAFPLPAIERKDFENHLSWGSSPTFTQKERFSIFRKEEQNKQASPGLDDLLSTRILPPSTQELMGLCSGQFSSQPIHCSMLEASQEAGVDDNASQGLDHVWLNDDVQSQTQSRKDDVKPNTKLNLILSDDEDILEIKTKARNKRKLDFSDDEEEAQGEQKEEEEESEDEDGSKNNDVEEGVEGNVDDIEYDSEENEIPRHGGQFLDKEAELSESDWESEDEDENGLDLLEQEEADKEKIDHDADKEELGKMHIRRMLVEDTKEVKLLQEMLLEDGDLHSDGNGRQRLFRWSNQAGDEEVKRSLVGDSDEEKADEEEDEEHWRRSRHERETFLREHNKKMEAVEVEEDLLEDDSQLFKLGKAALRKIQNSSQEPKLTPPTDPVTSPDAKQSFYQQAKRGSFLSRGQQVLSRLAQLTAGANSDAQVSKPKNSRNFVFASISPSKDEPEEPQPAMGTKRKRSVLPLPVAKRPCQTRVANKFSKKRSLLDQLAKCES